MEQPSILTACETHILTIVSIQITDNSFVLDNIVVSEQIEHVILTEEVALGICWQFR